MNEARSQSNHLLSIITVSFSLLQYYSYTESEDAQRCPRLPLETRPHSMLRAATTSSVEMRALQGRRLLLEMCGSLIYECPHMHIVFAERQKLAWNVGHKRECAPASAPASAASREGSHPRGRATQPRPPKLTRQQLCVRPQMMQLTAQQVCVLSQMGGRIIGGA